MFLLIQCLLTKRQDRYAESEQNELPHVNRQSSPPPQPPPSSPTSTRSQIIEGKKDEIVIEIYVEQESGDRECSIRLSEFKDQELFWCLPTCNHGFHFKCVKHVVGYQSNLPIVPPEYYP
ncbi:RING-H2 finger ATL39-like [Olea europaea subsp. europaea]|uniref:RING-H2 finger ATL39-like n=1 Tax=Olea europaea subsp. europaea TaxID=158383 RepID=A0A8S0P9V9_OLEEU|nr:RING-H2 finger ATL39-like [Olea europaea subsp. europaea]